MNDTEHRRLGDYIRMKHGYAFKGEHFSDVATSHVLVTPKNFSSGGSFQDRNLKYYAGPVPEGYILRSGDLVINMTDLSKTGDTLGYPALIPASTNHQYLHNQRIGLIEIYRDQDLDKRYLFYRLQADDYRQHVLTTASGSTVRYTSPERIYEFDAQFPPVQEQRAIAAILSAFDEKVQQNHKTARTLEQLIQTIFRAWFVDFEPVKSKAAGAISFPSMPQTVFDSLPSRFVDSEVGPVPNGWLIKPINEVVSIVGGATPSTKISEYWDGGIYCWATPKDMSRLAYPVLLDTERHITDAGISCIGSGLLAPGAVLMSSRAPIGYLAIANVPTAINQGFIAMVCDGPLPPIYILNWADTSMKAIQERASGTTFPEINRGNFRSLPVVVPPKMIISAFRGIADALFDRLTASVKERKHLKELRDYLLPRLLNGELQVRR